MTKKNEDLNNQLKGKNNELEEMKSEHDGVRKFLIELRGGEISSDEIKSLDELKKELIAYREAQKKALEESNNKVTEQETIIKGLQEELERISTVAIAEEVIPVAQEAKNQELIDARERLLVMHVENQSLKKKLEGIELAYNMQKKDLAQRKIYFAWKRYLIKQNFDKKIIENQKEFEKKNNETLDKINQLTNEVKELRSRSQEEEYWKSVQNDDRLQDENKNLKASNAEKDKKIRELEESQKAVKAKMSEMEKQLEEKEKIDVEGYLEAIKEFLNKQPKGRKVGGVVES